VKSIRDTCNSNRVDEKIVAGGESPKDNRWNESKNKPKLRYFNLENIVKICVNINKFTSEYLHLSSY
jgi:hypothetical protein